MMLNHVDMKMIDQDVESIIHDWSTAIEIWKLLPKDQQPGWNELMNEIQGEPLYDKRTDVMVEIREVPLVALETNNAGDKYSGKCVLCIPSSQDIDEDCLFILGGDTDNPWRVDEIKRRAGEYMVTVIKVVD